MTIDISTSTNLKLIPELRTFVLSEQFDGFIAPYLDQIKPERHVCATSYVSSGSKSLLERFPNVGLIATVEVSLAGFVETTLRMEIPGGDNEAQQFLAIGQTQVFLDDLDMKNRSIQTLRANTLTVLDTAEGYSCNDEYTFIARMYEEEFLDALEKEYSKLTSYVGERINTPELVTFEFCDDRLRTRFDTRAIFPTSLVPIVQLSISREFVTIAISSFTIDGKSQHYITSQLDRDGIRYWFQDQLQKLIVN